MLYSEFVKGTECKENEYNYEVYKELELIYMNSDCTKEHIYEMGKKLVDNSKSEKEIEVEKRINEEIDWYKGKIENYKQELEFRKQALDLWKEDGDKAMIKSARTAVNYVNSQIKSCRNKIKELKWILN